MLASVPGVCSPVRHSVEGGKHIHQNPTEMGRGRPHSKCTATSQEGKRDAQVRGAMDTGELLASLLLKGQNQKEHVNSNLSKFVISF